VTNGISLEETIQPRKSNKVTTIVTVSRATYYKGIDFAIDAVYKLVYHEGIRNFRYILYGDGPDLDAFKKRAEKLGVSEYVYLPGSVNNISECLIKSDIAFHPSKGEAMSLAILEYMRAYLPVVASDNPSVSSSLVHNDFALLYPEGDVNESVQILKKLILSKELRKRLGRSGRKKIETDYSEKAMLLRFSSALEKAITPQKP
tara:strand:- start:38 stop:646 length:609 start_codon:yes stop_codon:yes gene_type:complete